jgi:16S rRNA (uracil1498-N3)-methyltransferase
VHDPYFFTDEALPPSGSTDRIVLRGGDAHHLTAVRRAREGDRLLVSDGAGTVLEARIVGLGPGGVELERITERLVPRPAPVVRVFQALAKGAKVDLVVTKLVELGVDEVVVFTSGRSVPRWDPAKAAQMARRWATIAREAAKQSRRAWLPRLDGPVGFAEAASAVAAAAVALLADESSSVPLREVLPAEPGASLTVIIGPEGGLTGEEHDRFVAAGAVPFSLGPQVLRTETAALAAAALVLHRMGRLG